MSPKSAEHAKLNRTLTIWFQCLVFPMSIVTAFDYWLLYFKDCNLIYQFHAVHELISSVNHGVHSIIIPLVFLEYVIVDINQKRVPITHVLFIFLLIQLSYITFTHFLYLISNIWPYPFMAQTTLFEKLAMICLNCVIGVGSQTFLSINANTSHK